VNGVSAQVPGIHRQFSYEVLDFTGGLNTKSSRHLLGRNTLYSLRPDQLTSVLNMMREESGALITRLGYSKFNDTPLAPALGNTWISSIYEFRTETMGDFILVTAGNSIYLWDGLGDFTLVGTFDTQNTVFNWAKLNDIAIGVNGADSPVKFDGTTISGLAGSPFGAGVVAEYRNHIFMISGLTLFYTAVGTIEDWTTPGDAGQLPIPTRNGSRGTALLSFYDRLLVFTDREVFVLLGTDEPSFRFQVASYEYGHQGRADSVITAGNDVLFFDKQGVHRLSVTYNDSELGNLEERYASGIIEPTWQAFPSTSVDEGAAVNIVTESRAVFLRSTSGNLNNVAVVADYYHKDPIGNPSWDAWDNHPFQCATAVRSLAPGAVDILFGGRDGHVYQRGGHTDNGTDFLQSWTYTTDAGVPQWEKLIRWLKIFIDNVDGSSTVIEPFKIQLSCDFGLTGLTVTPDITIAGSKRLGIDWLLGTDAFFSSAIVFPQIPIPCVANYLSIIFSFKGTLRLRFRGFILYGGLRRLLR